MDTSSLQVGDIYKCLAEHGSAKCVVRITRVGARRADAEVLHATLTAESYANALESHNVFEVVQPFVGVHRVKVRHSEAHGWSFMADPGWHDSRMILWTDAPKWTPAVGRIRYVYDVYY